MLRPTVCALLLLGIISAQADEQVRAVQEELRRRRIYNGDIDGRQSPELGEALKRYQKRKGFTPTGQEDPDTLRSLALLPRSPNDPPPKEIQLPDEPVLRSDTKFNVEEEVAALAEETGIAPEAVALGEPQPGKRKKKPVKRVPPAETSRRLPKIARGGSEGAPMIEERELRAFVAGYVTALRRDNLQEELRYYSDRVNYFGNGQIDRRLVERTLRKYTLRWPKRRYFLLDGLKYAFFPKRGEVVVTFRVSFTLKNGSKTARGETENRVIINAGTADPRIVAIEESRVRG